ncbi:PIN domain-containing protein [Paenibacillus sp. IHB B 3084]|uniref:type II toxin-antitoxin system VapC family toxin n=1 Tax=Paenibacillus TaxID=44249 RepID=UPI00071FC6B3|nr:MULTISPECIES: PIN domain-containing protein [Paenibacillus]ALP37148.1 PIN domain-containing protein [Paenibacillus sp. IHB B 3084]
MGYLFDTNAAIALHRLDSSLDEVIRQAEKDKENIFFSTITQSEFIAGLPTETDLNSIPFLGGDFISVDSEIAIKAGRIRREQKDKCGRKLKTPDALILATAIINKLILVTADQDLQFAEFEYEVRVINFNKPESQELRKF